MKGLLKTYIPCLVVLVAAVILALLLIPRSVTKMLGIDRLQAADVEKIEFDVVYDRGMGWQTDDSEIIGEVLDALRQIKMTGETEDVTGAGPTIRFTLHLKAAVNGSKTVSFVLCDGELYSLSEKGKPTYFVSGGYGRAEWTTLLHKCEKTY